MSVDADNPIVLKSVQESKNAVIAMALAGVFDPIIPALTQVIGDTASASADAAAAAASASAAAASAAAADNVANQALALANSAVLDILDEGVLQTDICRSIDFVGAGVSVASNINGDVTVTVTGGSGAAVQEEGAPVVASPTAINFVGSSVTVTEDPAGVAKVTITDSGEANTASNVGAGEDVFKQKTGVDLEFRTLVAGANITITPAADTLTIAASGGGGGITELTGDVTAGPGSGSQAATVALVGGATAADVATSVADTQAATSGNTPGTLVKRGAGGEFTASDIQAYGLYVQTYAFYADSGTETISSDDYFLGVNNTLVVIASDSATATDRTIDLQTPSTGGQHLIILFTGPNAAELVPSASRVMAGTMTFSDGDTISFIGRGGVWYELSRSVNA